ncbi:MAG: hypothetical protein JXQ87_02210 [Bacteroidia bacterium]
MKQDKFNDWLIGALIVLVSVSIYNVNTVLKGIGDQYFTGLLITIVLSIAVSSFFIGKVGKTKKGA